MRGGHGDECVWAVVAVGGEAVSSRRWVLVASGVAQGVVEGGVDQQQETRVILLARSNEFGDAAASGQARLAGQQRRSAGGLGLEGSAELLVR